MTAGRSDERSAVAVQAFVDVPPELAEVARTFWSGVTGWPPNRHWADHHEFTALVAPMGTGGVSLQVGDVAPRVHLDLYPDGDPADLVDRLLSIGAHSVQRHDWWHVLESPGGLPFCVVQAASGSPAPPTAWPDGHRSRVVQVCVDIPAARWDVELRFWPAALGWATTRGSRAEFADLLAPPQSPLRVLLQRLRTDDTGSVVRAHLDLGADDVGAEVRRLVRLGARVGEQPDDAGGWVVLRDPLGSTFCVTARHP